MTQAQQRTLAGSAVQRTAPKGTLLHNGSADCVGLFVVLDGVLRVSFSYDTTREDVDALVRALTQAQKELFTSLS